MSLFHKFAKSLTKTKPKNEKIKLFFKNCSPG